MEPDDAERAEGGEEQPREREEHEPGEDLDRGVVLVELRRALRDHADEQVRRDVDRVPGDQDRRKQHVDEERLQEQHRRQERREDARVGVDLVVEQPERTQRRIVDIDAREQYGRSLGVALTSCVVRAPDALEAQLALVHVAGFVAHAGAMSALGPEQGARAMHEVVQLPALGRTHDVDERALDRGGELSRLLAQRGVVAGCGRARELRGQAQWRMERDQRARAEDVLVVVVQADGDDDRWRSFQAGSTPRRDSRAGPRRP